MKHCVSVMLLVIFCQAHIAHAEPYLAIKKGLKCLACHSSPSGAGKRTPYGNLFAATEMPAHKLPGKAANFWSGEISKYLAVGGDVRAAWNRIDVPGQAATEDAALSEILSYAELRPMPKYLTLYIDAKIAPDDVTVREQYARLSTQSGRIYLQAGEFFLPYGWRIQDDDAFIRQVSGINFNTPDSGWQLGWEQGNWSSQFAVSRGTAGGPEVDSGKQYSLRVSRVVSKWRVGGSVNFNDSALGDRQMQNIFAGLRTGRVAWLGEVDLIIDKGLSGGRRELWVALLEANISLGQGHNLKLTYEHFDPDGDIAENEQNRYSVVWEYSPIRFLQSRIGLRNFEGIPQNSAQNREQWFIELHLPF